MPTIYREGGFSVRIYPADHEPPHVHVFKAGEEAKIAIGSDAVPPDVMDPYGMRMKDIRGALRIVERNQADFLSIWRTYHG